VNTFFCLLLALMLAGTASAHEPIKLYMPDAPPLTLHHYEGGHGMAGDVVLAALYIWESSAYREQNLRRSPPLASTGLYLGCSKDCDAQLVEQLRAAISELEEDGVSQRLRQAYLPLQPDP